MVVWLVKRFGMGVDDMNTVDDPNLDSSHLKVLEHIIQHGNSAPVVRKGKSKWRASAEGAFLQ